MKRIAISILLAAALLLNAAVSAYGYALPGGSVAGLPQNLIIMDENGRTPAKGELYISIDNMQPFETYTKDLTIMNARGDEEFSIYMAATPNYTDGNIDLLGETECRLYLNNKLIYTGLVNGEGTPYMQRRGINLGGKYKCGESRTLHAEFVWRPTETERENGDYGVVSFFWTFSAFISSGSGMSSDKAAVHLPPSTKEVIKGTPGDGYPPIGDNPSDPSNPSYDPSNPSYDPNNPSYDPNNPNNDPDNPHYDPDNPRGEAPPGLIERLIDKAPLIPEDVKTGYRSLLVFYVWVLLAALTAAAVIMAVIGWKMLKLKRLRKNAEKNKANL